MPASSAHRNLATSREYAELYHSGLSTGQVTRRMGVNKATVRYHLKRCGVELPRTGRRMTTGPEHALWKGGRFVVSSGYVLVRQPGGSDNRPENLALVSAKTHDTQSYIKLLQQRIWYLEEN